jgi:hypothetical protein
MFSFLPSLIEVSRAAWCGVPLEVKEGTTPVWGTKGLSTRPRCITLISHSFIPVVAGIVLGSVVQYALFTWNVRGLEVQHAHH